MKTYFSHEILGTPAAKQIVGTVRERQTQAES